MITAASIATARWPRLSFKGMKSASAADAPEEVPPIDTLTATLDQARRALEEGRVADLLEHVGKVKALLPRDDAAMGMRMASLLQAAFRFSGEPALYEQALAACLAVADRTDQPEWAVPARALAGNVHMLAGRLHQAMEQCDAALSLAAACGMADHRVAAMGHQFRGYVLMEWNRLDEAGAALMAAWERAGEIDRGVRSGVARMMAELAFARGDLAAARHWSDVLAAIVSEPMTLRNREWLAAVRVRHGFAFKRDLRALDSWQRGHDYRIDALESLPPAAIAARLHEFDHLLLMLETTSQWSALASLAAIIERGSRPLRRWYLVRALTARAVALEATGASAAALELWADALAEGDIGSFVRVYTDGSPLRQRLLHRATTHASAAGHARRVLEAYEAPPDAALAPPLTERQLTVLRLVAAGLSDREISATVGLSVATIKTHLRAIYSRLDVPSRTAAVARASAAGLL